MLTRESCMSTCNIIMSTCNLFMLSFDLCWHTVHVILLHVGGRIMYIHVASSCTKIYSSSLIIYIFRNCRYVLKKKKRGNHTWQHHCFFLSQYSKSKCLKIGWMEIYLYSLVLGEVIQFMNKMLFSQNKRPMGLNGHLRIRDCTLTSCQKGSYLHINSPIKD